MTADAVVNTERVAAHVAAPDIRVWSATRIAPTSIGYAENLTANGTSGGTACVMSLTRDLVGAIEAGACDGSWNEGIGRGDMPAVTGLA